MSKMDAGGWLEVWLSAPRFATYLKATDQDRGRALALYDWNAAVAAAFHRDLGHLEVGLRNAYDAALRKGSRAGAPHWVFEPHRFFPAQPSKASNGRLHDANHKSRRLIEEAVAKATDSVAAEEVPGKAIAELNFGFWRYLSSRRNAELLWVPHLHAAFRPGTDRRAVDRPLDRLHMLRNRVAHHEPIFRSDVHGRHQDVLAVAGLLSNELAAYVGSTSGCPPLLRDRP